MAGTALIVGIPPQSAPAWGEGGTDRGRYGHVGHIRIRAVVRMKVPDGMGAGGEPQTQRPAGFYYVDAWP